MEQLSTYGWDVMMNKHSVEERKQMSHILRLVTTNYSRICFLWHAWIDWLSLSNVLFAEHVGNNRELLPSTGRKYIKNGGKES